MDEIYKNLEEYFALEMPNRYLSLKEIAIPIKNINFPYCHKYALAYFTAVDIAGKATITMMERLCSDKEHPELYVPTSKITILK